LIQVTANVKMPTLGRCSDPSGVLAVGGVRARSLGFDAGPGEFDQIGDAAYMSKRAPAAAGRLLVN
jgi:hypothetical protein